MCHRKHWKMEEKDGKTENKKRNWSDLEGLRKKKAYLDLLYADIDMKLGSKTLKMKKKSENI